MAITTNSLNANSTTPFPVSQGGTGANALTDHGVLVGSGTGAVTPLAVLTNGQLIVGSTGADPVPASLTSTGSSITVSGGAGTLNIDIAAPVSVANGGTGATSLTDHGILLGSGTGAITPTAAPTDGQLLIGSTGVDPVLATLTAGTDISIVNAAGSITINSTASGGLPFTDVTGTSQAMTENNGYTSGNAGTVTFTLPTTAAYGSVLAISGRAAGGWSIAQNASQVIHFGSSDTTTGVGGSLSSTNRYDCVYLLTVVADLEFVVQYAVGNLTVV